MNRVAMRLASAAVLLVAPSALTAQNVAQVDTVDPSLPTQLPRTAIPHHYAIVVTPHAERLSFDGTVAIDLDVVKPTAALVLNAADLSFSSATVVAARGGAPITRQANVDDAAQNATINLSGTLASAAE